MSIEHKKTMETNVVRYLRRHEAPVAHLAAHLFNEFKNSFTAVKSWHRQKRRDELVCLVPSANIRMIRKELENLDERNGAAIGALVDGLLFYTNGQTLMIDEVLVLPSPDEFNYLYHKDFESMGKNPFYLKFK